jgi:phage terminase small subunit
MKPNTPSRPPGMSTAAVRIWFELVPMLQRDGIVSTIDGAMLANLCEMRADYIRLSEIVADAELREVSFSRELHPAWRARLRLFYPLLKLESHFGLTPLGRARIVRANRSTH